MRKGIVPRLIRRFLACLLFSAVLWSWIFSLLSDPGPDRRILLYADMPSFRWKELAVALEEQAPEGISRVRVHPFSYAMMNSAEVETADLYVMTAAQAREHPDWLGPGPAPRPPRRGAPGAVRGIRLDPAADSFFLFSRQEAGPWYLFFGARSLHLSGPEAKDDAAARIAETLLSLDSPAP